MSQAPDQWLDHRCGHLGRIGSTATGAPGIKTEFGEVVAGEWFGDAVYEAVLRRAFR